MLTRRQNVFTAVFVPTFATSAASNSFSVLPSLFINEFIPERSPICVSAVARYVLRLESDHIERIT